MPASSAPANTRPVAADPVFPVYLSQGTSMLSRVVLSSPLFSIRRDLVRLTYTDEHPLILGSYECGQYGAAVIKYAGEELRQCDSRVLAEIINRLPTDKEAGRKTVAGRVLFDVADLVEALGWYQHPRSREKLRESIARLFTATVEVRHRLGSFSVRLLGGRGWSDDDSTGWVTLTPDFTDFFTAGFTYLPMRERTQLSDGLQTWLHGFFRAHSDRRRFKLEDLHACSGSGASPNKFQKLVKEAMPRLVEVGAVDSYEFTRGMITVFPGTKRGKAAVWPAAQTAAQTEQAEA